MLLNNDYELICNSTDDISMLNDKKNNVLVPEFKLLNLNNNLKDVERLILIIFLLLFFILVFGYLIYNFIFLDYFGLNLVSMKGGMR